MEALSVGTIVYLKLTQDREFGFLFIMLERERKREGETPIRGRVFIAVTTCHLVSETFHDVNCNYKWIKCIYNFFF